MVTTNKITMDKKYETRDGYAVRLYAIDGGSKYPVHGARKNEDGEWRILTWTRDGLRFEGSVDDRDLVEVRPERTVWVNVYLLKDQVYGGVHATKKGADYCSDATRSACLPITFREGDGLTPQ